MGQKFGHVYKALRPCTHEQIEYRLLEHIIADLLHTDPKLEQKRVIYLLMCTQLKGLAVKYADRWISRFYYRPTDALTISVL